MSLALSQAVHRPGWERKGTQQLLQRQPIQTHRHGLARRRKFGQSEEAAIPERDPARVVEDRQAVGNPVHDRLQHERPARQRRGAEFLVLRQKDAQRLLLLTHLRHIGRNGTVSPSGVR